MTTVSASNLLWPGDDRAGTLFGDGAFLDAMLAVEAAWSGALVDASVAPADAAVDVGRLRDALGVTDLDALAAAAESGGNPVIPLVALLRDRLGGTASAWLHRGLTSQDVVDTALMICAAEAFGRIGADLDEQVGLLTGLAETHRDSVMVARTLTQHAVPTTFGLKVAGWLQGVLDAREAVSALRFPAQIGGAAGTLAAGVELAAGSAATRTVLGAAQATASALGLEAATPWHTVRTAMTRCGDTAVTTSDAYGHVANDVLTLSRSEIAEVGEGSAGGSSTMPGKRNPVLSVLIRRHALCAPGLGATLHLAAAAALDERTPGGWHAEWDTLRTLVRRTVVAASQVTELLRDLDVDTDRMAANLAAAGDATTAEQRTMAGLAEHPPAAHYLGAADELIRMQVERAHRLRSGTQPPDDREDQP